MLNSLHQRIRQPALALIAVCAVWLLTPSTAHAQNVSCTATTSPSTLNAGSIIPWSSSAYSATGTISVSCSNNSIFRAYVSVCLSIGTGDAGLTFANRQITTSGSTSGSALGIGITTNNTYFGSYFDNYSAIQIPTQYMGAYSNASFGAVPVTVTVNAGQVTAPVGSYSSAYGGGHTAVSIATSRNNSGVSCASTGASGPTFPFTAAASVPSYCEFTASTIGDMNFADTTGILDGAKSSSTTLGVRCTKSTAYTITLRPSNNNTGGNGQMKAVGAPSNTDTVPYSLYQNSNGTTPWGSLAANDYAGTGTGNPVALMVYGIVPANLNVTPGTYRDSVTVTVTY